MPQNESLHDFQARMQADLAAKNQASPPPPGAGWSLAYHADGARWPEQDMLTTMPVAPVQAERDLLAAQVTAVRALHRRHPSDLPGHEDSYCGVCIDESFGYANASRWPCDTIRALDTAQQDQQP